MPCLFPGVGTTAEEQLLVAAELAEQASQQLAAEQSKSESLARELKRTQQMEQTWREIAWKASHKEPKAEPELEPEPEPEPPRARSPRQPRVAGLAGSTRVFKSEERTKKKKKKKDESEAPSLEAPADAAPRRMRSPLGGTSGRFGPGGIYDGDRYDLNEPPGHFRRARCRRPGLPVLPGCLTVVFLTVIDVGITLTEGADSDARCHCCASRPTLGTCAIGI